MAPKRRQRRVESDDEGPPATSSRAIDEVKLAADAAPTADSVVPDELGVSSVPPENAGRQSGRGKRRRTAAPAAGQELSVEPLETGSKEKAEVMPGADVVADEDARPEDPDARSLDVKPAKQKKEKPKREPKPKAKAASKGRKATPKGKAAPKAAAPAQAAAAAESEAEPADAEPEGSAPARKRKPPSRIPGVPADSVPWLVPTSFWPEAAEKEDEPGPKVSDFPEAKSWRQALRESLRRAGIEPGSEDEKWVLNHPLFDKLVNRGYPLPFGFREILALKGYTPKQYGGDATVRYL
eukprot:TRINITY_DN33940_c0_g1_i2.p1 TRINITY_DN33940_c0_g1~~TRINITY_DN33940_c0_g1_i2.p1  ORF type:complete len:296 (-),score=63.41 TRINITY_DN33940_c0_g1_i2:635-1522(-)